MPVDAPAPILTEVLIKPAPRVVAMTPDSPVDSSPAVAFAPIADPAPVPSPLPVELALLPIVEESAPTPAPTLAAMPPVVDIVSSPAPNPMPAVVDSTSPAPSVVAAVSPEVAATPAPAVVEAEQVAPADPDVAFRKIVSSMASSFAADNATSMPTPEPKPLLARIESPALPVPAPAPAAEEVAVADPEMALYPGVAIALDPEADGALPVEAAARAEPSTATASVSEPSRAERLSHAVKLTGEAVNAWAGLLSQRTASSAVQR